jgi:diadenosine tetraphosphatase ApaH/serine/threonine PP2A family protein phosphatase
MAQRAGLSDGDAILFGHTHLPWQRRVDGILFVNTGSVGRPKDGDPRAGYVLLEAAALDAPEVDAAEGWRAEHVRVPYDVERAARAVETSGLPDAFAAQLREGRT